MSKEKQIDELTNELVFTSNYGTYKAVATYLVNEGYRKQSEWISVEERLPESGVHCILCCDMKRIDGTHSQYVCDGYFAERWKIIAHYVDDDCATEYNEIEDEYYLKKGWYEVIKNWDDYNSIVIDDTVTHWMPLPEPPKKGGE
jgi:hypothetical protein